MEGVPRELVRALHGPLCVVAREAEDVFIGEAEDRFEGALSADRVDEFEHGLLSLAANDVVDVFCIERGVGVDRRKISTPYDLYVWIKTADFAGGLHRRDHLRAGHNRDSE